MTVSIGILLSCSKDPEPVDCSKSELMADLILVESASGCGVADGRIEINAKGGLGPYQYAMIDKSFQSTGDFTMLMPGIYSFLIRDKNQCEVVLSNITLMATDISFTAEIVENTKCVGGME